MKLSHQLRIGPLLPVQIRGIAAPVRIRIVKDFDDNERTLGQWVLSQREIRVWSGLSSAEVVWPVFFHELAHSWFTDTGLHNVLQNGLIEAVCDVVGTGLFRLMLRYRGTGACEKGVVRVDVGE